MKKISIMQKIEETLSRRESRFWSLSHKRLILGLSTLFLVLLSLRLHGYSLPEWKRFLPSEGEDIVFGQSRGIRSDDAFVALPLAFSQLKTTPRFACNNNLIGSDVTLWYRSLCLEGWGWLAAFLKPQTWGYIWSADLGMAWQWWTVYLGLFYSAFLFLYMVTGRLLYVSLFLAGAFVYSPYQQFWSLNQGEIFICGFVLCLCIQSFLTGRASGWKLGFLIFTFSLALSNLILTLYPPAQVQIGFFVGCFFILNAFRTEAQRLKFAALYLSLGILISLLASGLIFFHSSHEFLAMARSDYPGKRVALGGGMHWMSWLQANFLPSRSVRNWDLLGNVCESASFVLFFPWLLPSIMSSRERWMRPINAFYFLALGFCLFWMVRGVSESLARWTLLSFVPASKGVITIGLLDLCFLANFLRDFRFEGPTRINRISIVLGLLFSVFLAFSVCRQLNQVANIPLLRFLPYLCLAGLALWLAFRKPLYLAPLAFLWSFSLTFHFNPLVKGGSERIFEAKLSQELQAIHQKFPNEKWAFENLNLVQGELPRMLGIQSISGTLPYPQIDLWKSFDSKGKYKREYNRYGHVSFRFRDIPNPVFLNPQPDQIAVEVSPKHEAFERLGVTIFAVVAPLAEVFSEENFELLYEDAGLGYLKVFKRRDAH